MGREWKVSTRTAGTSASDTCADFLFFTKTKALTAVHRCEPATQERMGFLIVMYFLAAKCMSLAA